MKNKNELFHSELGEIVQDDMNNKFFQYMKGKEIDPMFTDNPAEKILLATQRERVGTSASIISEILYFRLNVTAYNNDRTFNGQGWSLSSVGAGKFSGRLYSDDLIMLYLKAHKFWFYEFLTLIFFTFYDSNSKYLGTFRGNVFRQLMVLVLVQVFFISSN
ncbi:VapA/VapB family virulence-associated protein [Xenorhabdus lircayensis]|uniref:VapA/VapB family virulence-associated protein n=1 Tax=Xenorhabdus lircayensis TaxID=2763499 RepID=A0ABS0U4Z6_9GAMM|nr:VapA/VapB family virulence-associated protein [Xenorhabdus lircayensis]MBI6548960.1 VapA/VapB family virulence-associated protein [Xenorhabdus lircayensis]